jgi:hypothetical protein
MFLWLETRLRAHRPVRILENVCGTVFCSPFPTFDGCGEESDRSNLENTLWYVTFARVTTKKSVQTDALEYKYQVIRSR